MHQTDPAKIELFERAPIGKALFTMALPTVMSQLITLIYNMADTWFIGRVNNPYMVAASSLVLTVFLLTVTISNLFGIGGGTLTVRLMGAGDEAEARRVAPLTLLLASGAALLFSLLVGVFMDPLLRLLGASDLTIGYARQYISAVVVVGALPTVLSAVMSAELRNVGYSKEAGFGLAMGGLLNIALDPFFMFVILPDGFQVLGAGIATMLSNLAATLYFIVVIKRVSHESALSIPRGIPRVRPDSLKKIFSVGIPASMSVLFFDVANMFANRLASGYGDIPVAALGIVFKVERLPLNTGIGICLGMAPLVAYNYASKNRERMLAFFRTARAAAVGIALVSAVLYSLFAPQFIQLFINDAETIRYGTMILKARCLATPVMVLSFHMVHFAQATGQARLSFWLPIIRQFVFNIPIMLLLNHFFGLDGLIWTQLTADALNVIATYIVASNMRFDGERLRLI